MPELDAWRPAYFQGLICILQWIIELGQTDILVHVSLLSQHLPCHEKDILNKCSTSLHI